MTTISEPVSTAVLAAPLKSDKDHALAIQSGNITLTQSGVEGDTYQVLAFSDLTVWSALPPAILASGDGSVRVVEKATARTNPRRFYRATRTSLATYHRHGIAGTYFTITTPVGGDANTVTPDNAARGSAMSVVIELPTPPPPARA